MSAAEHYEINLGCFDVYDLSESKMKAVKEINKNFKRWRIIKNISRKQAAIFLKIDWLIKKSNLPILNLHYFLGMTYLRARWGLGEKEEEEKKKKEEDPGSIWASKFSKIYVDLLCFGLCLLGA